MPRCLVMSEQGHEGADAPMSREQLDSPEMKAAIARARELAAKPRVEGGSTADDLKRMADEIRRHLAAPT